MSRETENVLLLLMGVATAMIAITGSYLRYVKPGLLPWLALTAVLLIGLAVSAMVRDIRRGGPHATDDPHETGDGHAHRPAMAWLLVLPIAVMVFVVPPALGARTATPTSTNVAADVVRRPFPALPAERAPVVALPEVLMRVAADSAGTLDGRLITITGFTMKEGSATDLARVVIICCAADAQLASIHLAGPAAARAADYPEDTWLSVEGRLAPAPAGATKDSKRIPTLAVSNVTRIDKPANTYAY